MDRSRTGSPLAVLLLALTACGVDAVGSPQTGDDPIHGNNGAPGNGAPGNGGPGSSDEGGTVGVGDGGVGGTNDGASPPPPPPANPASCAEIPNVKNATATLYAGRDPAKPWSAHCGSAGETYLVLAAGPAANWSAYPSGGCANALGPAWVRTGWSRVRIDPATFVVTTNDFAGATSFGDTHEVSGDGAIDFHYRSMPFATGRSCKEDDTAVVARVDLSQTPFRVANDNAYLTEGFRGQGANDLKSNGAVLELKVRGFPAGIHACPAGDYYQKTGGACLKLVYAGK